MKNFPNITERTNNQLKTDLELLFKHAEAFKNGVIETSYNDAQQLSSLSVTLGVFAEAITEVAYELNKRFENSEF